jgi:hypothetical protein
MTIPFKTIRARAEKRKGGAKALQKLLPERPDPKALTKLGDDRQRLVCRQRNDRGAMLDPDALRDRVGAARQSSGPRR